MNTLDLSTDVDRHSCTGLGDEGRDTVTSEATPLSTPPQSETGWQVRGLLKDGDTYGERDNDRVGKEKWETGVSRRETAETDWKHLGGSTSTGT